MSEKPGGGNRIAQIVMVLVTSVVGPLIVFFVTNGVKQGQPTSLAATLPPALTASAVQQPTVAAPGVPGGVSNPSGWIAAGTPAVVDNLALTVDSSDVRLDGNFIRLSLHIRNLGSTRRTLVYAPGAIKVSDAAGNTYEAYLGDKKNSCRKGDLGFSKNVQIDPGADLVLTSPAAADATWWCSGDKNEYLPLYVGPIQPGAGSLRIELNGVGPFQGFGFEVPL